MTSIYEAFTGRSGNIASAAASAAMLNGVLVRILMASRVVYGILNEQGNNNWLALIHSRRRTPERAIWLIVILVAISATARPIVKLAKLTSVLLLSVFSLVDFSLWRIGSTETAYPLLRRRRLWVLAALAFSTSLLILKLLRIAR